MWGYFIDKVSGINMFSMIMILIAFNIKFQCQYYYYNLNGSVATRESSVSFYLSMIFFGKTCILLSLVYLIKQFIENFILGKRKEIDDIFVYVKLTVITLKRVKSAQSLNFFSKKFEYSDNESVFSLKKTKGILKANTNIEPFDIHVVKMGVYRTFIS